MSRDQSADGVDRRIDEYRCICGSGDLELVDHRSTDVSGTEVYECQACGATGSLYWSDGDRKEPTANGAIGLK